MKNEYEKLKHVYPCNLWTVVKLKILFYKKINK